MLAFHVFGTKEIVVYVIVVVIVLAVIGGISCADGQRPSAGVPGSAPSQT